VSHADYTRRRWLRNRPIRVKLAIILLLPFSAIVGLTGLTVYGAAGRAADAGQARELVVVGGLAARLAAALQAERSAAALVFAVGGGRQAQDDYRRAGAATDAATEAFLAEVARAAVPASVASLLARIDTNLDGLVPMREQVLSAPDTVLSTVAFRYRATIADLISYRQALGQVDVSAETSNGLRAAAALSAAIESLGQLQTATLRSMAAGVLTPAAQQEIVAANTGVTEALQTFTELGPPSWSTLLNSGLAGDEQVRLSERLQNVVTRSQPGAVMQLGVDARGWSTAVAARMDLMHAVESELDTRLLAAVTAERDAQVRSIVTASGVVAALLLVVVVIGWVVASSLSRSLSRLQAGAIEVAAHRLPQMVHELDVDNVDPATVQRVIGDAAQPVPVDGRDEVGRVAEAFNQVTSAAVRIAGEQAALRASIGAILVALARRLQLRADAMMGTLDALEAEETNTDRLARLFALDHVATLIRRLIFNLQVLAGGRGGRARQGAITLDDVIRAAGQEIDDFTRVVTTAVDRSVRIRGEAVDEIVHLLAELLDNATRFSPPDSQVRVEAKRVGDQLHIQIRDTGAGMAETDLELARERVANPGRLDHRVTQHMGLPVVGAIAQRLGIRVEFRSVLRLGTWVDLTIPAELLERRRSGVNEDTAQLSTMSAALRAAALPAWPAPASAAPQLVEPVIFEQMRRDGSWFEPAQAGWPPAVSWQEAARAAQLASTASAEERTEHGLPVRQPMRRVIPRVAPVLGQPGPVRRDPEQLRRQMSGFQHGLGLAGRRQAQPTTSGGQG